MWRDRLRCLVKWSNIATFPLLVFKTNPPSGISWPDNLPSSAEILALYTICDGGFLGEFNWFGLSPLLPVQEQIILQNEFWWNALKNYYPDESSPLERECHLILGVDSAGAPLIWNKTTDAVATFFFKGGDWEPLAESFERFMNQLFCTKAQEQNDLWHEALLQLDEMKS